ncbi:hypothetical protein Tco_1248490, partial [Tanacetum coccineum]
VKMDNSRTLKYDGREKVVNSRFSLAHHQAKPRRKHKDDGFCSTYSHKTSTNVTSWIASLAIRVR